MLALPFGKLLILRNYAHIFNFVFILQSLATNICIPCHNTSVEGLLAEWNDSSFTTLKVMWSQVSVQGAVTTYRVTYLSVGNTVQAMNTSNSTEHTLTVRNNNIVITDLNPKEIYFLYVETIISAVNGNNFQVAIGK